MQFRIFRVLLVLVLAFPLAAQNRTENDRRLQMGFLFTALHVNKLREVPGGFGLRAGYDLVPSRQGNGAVLSVEGEFNYFPQNPSGNFGESQFLSGIKAGYVADPVAVFVKVRPGLVHFSGRDFAARNRGPGTNFATDAGVVMEYYLSDRVGVRLDWGDTLIYFPDPVFTGGITADPAGLTHNLQGSLGLVFRF